MRGWEAWGREVEVSIFTDKLTVVSGFIHSSFIYTGALVEKGRINKRDPWNPDVFIFCGYLNQSSVFSQLLTISFLTIMHDVEYEISILTKSFNWISFIWQTGIWTQWGLEPFPCFFFFCKVCSSYMFQQQQLVKIR